MTHEHHPAALGAHVLVGLASGLTGAALADRLVTVLLGLVSSLAVVVVQEALRDRRERRAREDRRRRDTPEPPPLPDDATG